MISQSIPNSPSPCIGVDFVNFQQVSLEWIQTLSPELKDAALYRLCKIVESKPTLCESFTLSQVLYRTISGNTFTESAENVAERTLCDRKTILKGLHQAVEQNILECEECSSICNHSCYNYYNYDHNSRQYHDWFYIYNFSTSSAARSC